MDIKYAEILYNQKVIGAGFYFVILKGMSETLIKLMKNGSEQKPLLNPLLQLHCLRQRTSERKTLTSQLI